eukprot:TRINITY_DN81136_c0_g1_i1.p1 TRINITY_DN81136_c0_g1~~TRINITY_DN81136_c0_g1_i1.p1  ORF type:complete len:349 (-),score=62.43 TRINITY_DN81136_c0_g1_i1:105-1151(-)
MATGSNGPVVTMPVFLFFFLSLASWPETDAVTGALMRKDSGSIERAEVGTAHQEDGAGVNGAAKCRLYPNRRVVLVTVDGTYTDFFENWLLYAERLLTSQEQVVAIAEDAKALSALHRLQLGADGKERYDIVEEEPDIHALISAVKLEGGDGASPYGTEGFVKLVTRRSRRISRFLEHGCAVLYVDVDTVWLRSPFDDIATAGDHEIYFTDDKPKDSMNVADYCKPKSSEPPNICTCFMFVRPTKQAMTLIRDWTMLAALEQNQEHGCQVQFNAVFCRNIKSIDYAVLPKDRYPSGELLRGQSNKFFTSGGPTVVHANYRVGHENKKIFLQQNGVWNLTDPSQSARVL